MSIFAAHESDTTAYETDVAIIGAGAAGLTLAAHLDTECVVVESGNRAIDINRHHLFHSINAGEPTKVDSLRVRGIGGATLRWTGRCTQMDPYDFEDRSWIAETGWPIEHDALAKWYRAAWKMLNIEPKRSPRNGLAALCDDTLSPHVWDYADGGKEGVLRFGDVFAKAFTDPRKTLLHSAHCTEILANGAEVKAIKLVDFAGRNILLRAKRFVIASGCIETSRLLLSAKRNNPRLLHMVEPWLGRGFMQHLRVDAGVLHAEPDQFRQVQKLIGITRSRRGNSVETGLALSPDHARERQLGSASAIFHYTPERGMSPLDWQPSVSSRLTGTTPIFRRGTARLEVDGEQAVTRRSHIALAKDTDMHGQPRAEVHWAIEDVDIRTVFEITRLVSDFVQAQGLGQLIVSEGLTQDTLDPALRRESNHQLGGTRMGQSAANSVVDAGLRVHDTANLWCVGGSVFATGGHANPTLTIMALALRLADQFSAPVG